MTPPFLRRILPFPQTAHMRHLKRRRNISFGLRTTLSASILLLRAAAITTGQGSFLRSFCPSHSRTRYVIYQFRFMAMAEMFETGSTLRTIAGQYYWRWNKAERGRCITWAPVTNGTTLRSLNHYLKKLASL